MQKSLEKKSKRLNNINCLEKNKCSGCGACFNICPVNAITMNPDEEGFLYPQIDFDKCTNCGLCVKSCAPLNPQYKNKEMPESYAVWANDEIREKSSSGGMFSLIADYVLEQGGYVCGAAFDENWNVKHIIVDNKEDLSKLKGSKYVQSDTNNVYSEIKTLLDDNKQVLFSGCPCQVAGLNGFLKKDYGNLITLDLVCHGVPSPKLWQQYLKENFADKEIEKIDFRDKSFYGWSTHMNIYFTDGTTHRNTCDKDPYYKAFLPCLSLRPFCGECSFTRLPRQGDITMADFWGIHEYNTELNDKKGTSLILINNTKGKSLFNLLKKQMLLCKKIPMEFTLSTINQTILRPFPTHPARERFFKLLNKGVPFNKAVDDSLGFKYDVGIVSTWFANNYGAIFTAYALHEIIKSFGLEPLMINKPTIMWSRDSISPEKPSRVFASNHYDVSRIYHSKLDLKTLNNHCDTFLVGCDQLWNYENIYKTAEHFTFLDFADLNKKKISYSTSFGNKEFETTEKEKRIVEYYLKRFDYLSVREDSGVDICKKEFNVDAVSTLDPVFICDYNNYEELIQQASVSEQEDYIATYILDPNLEKQKALLYASDKLNLKLVNIIDLELHDKVRHNWDLEAKENVTPEDWLYYMNNAKFIITDSFHGACFATIFNKPFICFTNNWRGSSRYESLFPKLNLWHRILNNPAEVGNKDYLFENVDYTEINKILEVEKESSLQWLKNSLEGPRTKVLTPEEKMVEIIKDELEGNLFNLEHRICVNSDTIDQQRNTIDYLIQEKDYLIREKDCLVHDRNYLIQERNYLVQERNYLTAKTKYLANKKKLIIDYFYYKLLSRITFGKLRRFYRQKYVKTRGKIVLY